jgi:hypothetical protein
VVADNACAISGGGLANSQGDFQNLIVWDNEAGFSGSQIAFSTSPTYSCIQNWTQGGVGNIIQNPDFIAQGAGDYRLDGGSPCVDKGNPDPAFYDACLLPPGLKTPLNDMGAYGGPFNCSRAGRTVVPGVAFTRPKAAETFVPNSQTAFAFKGLAYHQTFDIIKVEYRVNVGAWLLANGTNTWSFTAALDVGVNTVEVRAWASDSSFSETALAAVIRQSTTTKAAILGALLNSDSVDLDQMDLNHNGEVDIGDLLVFIRTEASLP